MFSEGILVRKLLANWQKRKGKKKKKEEMARIENDEARKQEISERSPALSSDLDFCLKCWLLTLSNPAIKSADILLWTEEAQSPFVHISGALTDRHSCGPKSNHWPGDKVLYNSVYTVDPQVVIKCLQKPWSLSVTVKASSPCWAEKSTHGLYP